MIEQYNDETGKWEPVPGTANKLTDQVGIEVDIETEVVSLGNQVKLVGADRPWIINESGDYKAPQ